MYSKTSTSMNMNDCDEMSDLSFQEDAQKEFSSASDPVRRRFYCKVFGCSKSYSHSSSLYRHMGSSHPIFASFRNEQTTLLNRVDFSINHDDRLHQIARQNQEFNTVNRSIQEEAQCLKQQMISAGQGALFAQFNSLLEMIPHADSAVIDHLYRFDSILHKALFGEVESMRVDMDVVVNEREQLPGNSSAYSSSEEVNTQDNNELCSAHILGCSSDTTLADQFATELYDAGGDM